MIAKPTLLRNSLVVCHNELKIFFFVFHFDLFKSRCGNPGIFASRINQYLGNDDGLIAVSYVLDLTFDVQSSDFNRTAKS